jgi:hypothetical protein
MQDGMGYRRRRRSLGNHHGRDAVAAQNFSRHRAKRFAQKARIASDNHTRAARLLRDHVTGNPSHGPSNVRKSKFLSNHRPPSRGAKLDRSCHRCLPAVCKFEALQSKTGCGIKETLIKFFCHPTGADTSHSEASAEWRNPCSQSMLCEEPVLSLPKETCCYLGKDSTCGSK